MSELLSIFDLEIVFSLISKSIALNQYSCHLKESGILPKIIYVGEGGGGIGLSDFAYTLFYFGMNRKNRGKIRKGTLQMH